MRFLRNLWLMSLLGLLTITQIGCASVGGNARAGLPLSSAPRAVEDYLLLVNTDSAGSLRAWVREADRTIRANNVAAEAGQ